MESLRPFTSFVPSRRSRAYGRVATRVLIIVAGVIGSFCPTTVLAQASLASEDMILSLVVQVRGREEAFTVIRDAVQPSQWYYVPDRPRLVERRVSGADEPEFNFVKYQFRDPKDPQKELEGGILQFAATLDLPPDAIKDLQKQIGAKAAAAAAAGGRGATRAEEIRLAPLPLKSAEVAVYAPKDGTMIPSDSFGSGNAPTIASQKMVFSIPLTQIGADVYDALVRKGNTGVPVVCTLRYNGLTPPAGFKVTYDWKLIYDHFSKDDHEKLHISFFGLFDYSKSTHRSELMERLQKSKALKVEVIEGESFRMDQIDKYLTPILNRIATEVVEDMSTAAITPAAAAKEPKVEPKGGPAFGGYGRSIAIKKLNLRKSTTETVEFRNRQLQERVTVAGGYIGIGDYADEIKAKLITEVPRGDWSKAFFVLPTIFDDRSLAVQAVDLQISLLARDEQLESSTYRWAPGEGWKDMRGAPRTLALFPLVGVKAKIGEAASKELRFVTNTKVTQGGEVVSASRTTPVSGDSGTEIPIASLPDVMDQVGMDPSNLSWKQIDPTSELVAVTVRLTAGGRRFTDTIKPRIVDGKPLPPETRKWLLPKNDDGSSVPVTADVEFVTAAGRRVPWSNNGKDLRSAVGDPKAVQLFDADWKR